MEELTKIINNLREDENVDAVFLTGSQGDKHKPYSDIDLGVIFNENINNLTSLYTWIDDKFADIFFFDTEDLKRVEETKEFSGNSMDAIFIAWLLQSDIKFDKSGTLIELKNKIDELKTKMNITVSEKDSFWQKINYNFVANTRYFNSGDSLYLEALELRLLYSVSEVLSGYFVFRDMAWRGEKAAVKYLKENDLDFYNTFTSYTKSIDLEERFKYYSKLVSLVFTDEYDFWKKGDVIPMVDNKPDTSDKFVKYWNNILGE